MQRRFAEPTQCAYWHNPELVRAASMKEGFELIDGPRAARPGLATIGRFSLAGRTIIINRYSSVAGAACDGSGPGLRFAPIPARGLP
jgi:hypothetical protein